MVGISWVALAFMISLTSFQVVWFASQSQLDFYKNHGNLNSKKFSAASPASTEVDAMSNNGFIENELQKNRFNSERPFIVFRCTELCGGLGDRLNGMISTLYLSLLLNRRLLFLLNFPFQFSVFFRTSPHSFLSYNDVDKVQQECPNSTKTKIEYWMDQPDDSFFRNTNFAGRWDGLECVFIRMNHNNWKSLVANKFMPNVFLKHYLNQMSVSEMARVALKILIVPKAEIRAKIDPPITPAINIIKIGIHHRLGDASFNSGGGVRHSVDQALCFAKQAHKICNEWRYVSDKPRCWYFLTCDSLIACNEIRKYLGNLNSTHTIFENKGPIVHVDKPSHGILKNISDITTMYARTISDWWILTKMNQLVISRSSFSETASYVANTEVYSFSKSTIPYLTVLPFTCNS